MKRSCLLGLVLSVVGSPVYAANMTVTMNAVDEKGVGSSVGTVEISSTKFGTVFTPNLKGLTPGVHGFHIHTNPACGPKEKDGKPVAGLAAGGHYDPGKSGKHGAPWGGGHLGDLPALYVDADGTSTNPVLAPRVKFADLKGRSLMIHAGGDNHSDHPKPLGGGGARVACGVIK
jgi:superoxide dismutase, Cu-Zn family